MKKIPIKSMLQTLDLIVMTEIIQTRSHLHHILETLKVTAPHTRILIPIAVILVMLVLVQEIGHLPENEKGSPRTDKAGIGKVGQEKGSKVAGKEGLMKDNQMGAGQGKNQNIGESRVLSPIPGLINTAEPQIGQPPRINNAPKDTEDHPQATQMTHVPDLGHRTVAECVVPRVIDPPHSSLIVGTTPEAAKEDQHSNVEKVATGNVLIPKDAKAALSTGAGLKIGKVLQPSQAEAQVEIDKDFVHIVVDLNVRWQNAMFLKKWIYLTIHVNFVLPSSCTERGPIARLFRVTGPPQQ
jgi:hypothetical protein